MSVMTVYLREAREIAAGRSAEPITPMHLRAALLHADDLQSRIDLFSQEARTIADEKHRERLCATLEPPVAFAGLASASVPATVLIAAPECART